MSSAHSRTSAPQCELQQFEVDLTISRRLFMMVTGGYGEDGMEFATY
jgi:hypothetical protein